jgi:peroxiredoxin
MSDLLQPQLKALRDGFWTNGSKPIIAALTESIDGVKASFDPSPSPSPPRLGNPLTALETAIQVGATLPAFNLTDAYGKAVSSTELLAQGPLLIALYRGQWCPFCNLELAALQKRLPEFKAKGVQLIAITSELPPQALVGVDKNKLTFPVLSDVGLVLTRQLGLVWKMGDDMRPTFKLLGNDLEAWNGNDSFELPIPATLLVDQKSVVRNIFVDADYTTRIEPQTAVDWVNAL